MDFPNTLVLVIHLLLTSLSYFFHLPPHPNFTLQLSFICPSIPHVFYRIIQTDGPILVSWFPQVLQVEHNNLNVLS